MDIRASLTDARSFLFVPGNRPERFAKAAASGADAVVLDLEDSVPAASKHIARSHVVEQWATLLTAGVPLVVRLNADDSDAWQGDVEALANLAGLTAVMVPKAESSGRLQDLHSRLGGVPLLPLIETVTGYFEVKAIADTPGVSRLVIGHIDFMADAGILCDEEETELLPLRFAVAMATRAARLASAIDGVTVETSADDQLRRDTLRGRRLGFGGKLCIHPRQISAIHDALAPSEVELDWARRVVAADAASQGAAVQLDGRMVDLPVVKQALRTLARVVAPEGPSS